MVYLRMKGGSEQECQNLLRRQEQGLRTVLGSHSREAADGPRGNAPGWRSGWKGLRSEEKGEAWREGPWVTLGECQPENRG